MAKHKSTNVGIAVNTEWIELVQLGRDLKSISKSVKLPVPMATLDQSGDRLRDPQMLATSIAAMIAELGSKANVKNVHLSVPGTLVRIVEMPKIPKTELVLALTSEAERYAIFNDTEALVDYEVIAEEADEKQKIILVALRKDTVAGYKEAMDMARLKLSTLEVETISSLRGFKYSGALEKVLNEVGDQPWGTVHFSSERIRIAIWQYDQIKNWREVILDTSDLKVMGEEAPVIQDLVEEVRRTIGMTRPALWLTYGIPENLSASLSSRLGAPTRAMLAGDAIRLDDPKLTLASIGVCTKSYERFPAFINVKPSADIEAATTEIMPAFKIMMALGVVLAILIILGTLVLGALGWFTGTQLEKLNTENNTLNAEVSQLEVEVNELRKRESVIRELDEKIRAITSKNKLISHVSDALQDRIPSRVWLEKVIISDNVSIEGKALDSDSILLFSNNFDETREALFKRPSPIKNVSLQKVEEESEKGFPVYKFTLTGEPRL